ncbi:DDT domain-containing protein [Xylogone sp. PMI_703]|nr:DDT domain-containing protein [Xylogone sp. PMI_703]
MAMGSAVLFKRKPVQYVSKPEIENDDTEVIPQTGEIFVDYELYLNRFICQITGHSGLSFFEALKSEEVEESFLEALKGPILRRIQFQTISKIDTLAVTVHVLTGERLTGIVRDKTRFGAKYMPDGSYSAPFSRYFVSLDGRPTEEAVMDDVHINRDQKVFTKQTGAPWLVKPEMAEIYHIDTRVPPHLRYENGMVGSFQVNTQSKLPELRPSPKSHKSKQQQQAQAQAQAQGQPGKGKKKPTLNPAPTNPNGLRFVNSHPLSMDPSTDPTIFEVHGIRYRNSNMEYPPYNQGALLPPFLFVPAQAAPPPPPPPPPPPIKYPIEDLQFPPKPDAVKRPQLKYFSQDIPGQGTKTTDGRGISMKSVRPLLEVWDTLNVYCEVFKLDSFTFDDFVEALQFSAEDVDCELFVEIHCAALKLLVNSEVKGDEENDEEESEEETAHHQYQLLNQNYHEVEPRGVVWQRPKQKP